MTKRPTSTPIQWHLAQANIAKMRGTLDDPVMAGFVAQLDTLNAVADQAPGFVWRLQTEDGNATAIRSGDDAMILFNLSLWRSIKELETYVYRSVHIEAFRDRDAWFQPLGRPHQALWWLPAGRLPTVEEATERLELIQEHGAGPRAFTFKQRFPPPRQAPASGQTSA